MFLRSPPPKASRNPTPVPDIDRYFDPRKAEGENSGGKENNNYEKEKTDNNTTGRTNKEQTNHNTRFIRPNHNALFGYFIADEFTGSILPERRVNTDKNNGDISHRSDQANDKLKDNIKPEKEKDNSESGSQYRDTHNDNRDYSALQRRINEAEARLETESNLRYHPQRVGEVESAMEPRGQLEQQYKRHSARIHDLEDQLRNVQMENRAIKGRLLESDQSAGYGAPIPEYEEQYSPRRRDEPHGYDDRNGDGRNGGDRNLNKFDEMNKIKYVRGEDRSGPLATNDQYNTQHAGKIKDEQGRLYWGMNKIYDPNIMTSYRNEHVPYLMNKAEKEREAEYHDRKKEMEYRYMREGQKFADFGRPYDNLHPPKDINKYFHYHGDRYPEKVREREYDRTKDSKILDTIYQTTYSDFEFKDGYGNALAGGLSLIRFHQNSFQDVNTALHLLQRSMSVSGASVGIASSNNVMVLHGDRGWRISKDPPRPQIPCRYMTVHDAILATWFPSKTKASELFRGEHNNRFKDTTFLNPYGYDSTFVPLKEVPNENFDVFLILEVENANRYHKQLQEFEADTRDLMREHVRNCQPYVGSVIYKPQDMQVDGLRPGAMFRGGSHVFISAFEQLSDVAKVWRILTDMLGRHRINADIQAFAYSVKDMKDHFRTPHWR